MSADGEAVEFDKTLGQSHRDLHRILPRVLDGMHYEAGDTAYRVQWNERTLDIAFDDESFHQIALMKMPQTRVVFRFVAWKAHEINDFMDRFHRSFQKGGG